MCRFLAKTQFLKSLLKYSITKKKDIVQGRFMTCIFLLVSVNLGKRTLFAIG